MPGRPRSDAARRRRAVEFGALAVILIWAGNFVVIKAATTTVPPLGFAALRFALAAAVMLLVLRWREGSVALPRHLWMPVGLVGALGFGIYQALWAIGLTLTTAGVSALLIAATPIFTTIVAIVIATERAHRARFAGAAIAFVGVGVVVAAGGGFRVEAIGPGDLLTVVAAACWGSYLALSAPFLVELTPIRLTAWAITAGAAVLAVPGAVQLATAGPERWATPAAALAIAYCGVLAAALSNVLFFRAIALVGPSRVANLQFLTPALVVVLAAVALGESILAGQLVGFAVIIGGILVARRAPHGPPAGRRPTPEPTPLIEA